MLVRPYKSQDAQKIKALVASVVSDEYGFAHHTREDLANIQDTYLSKGCFFVAEENQQILGCAGVERTSPTDGKLRRMHVQKTHRRKGIGKALLQQIKQWCTENNVKQLYLSTDTRMQQGIAFYQKNGFKHIPTLPEHINPDQGDTVFFTINT